MSERFYLNKESCYLESFSALAATLVVVDVSFSFPFLLADFSGRFFAIGIASFLCILKLY